MNYLVCIKQVPDTTTRIQLTKDQKNVDLSSVKWVINPYDEFAIEEALRMSEEDLAKKQPSNVEVCTIGPARSKEALRTALAMGANKGFHIETDKELDSFAAAKAVSIVLKEKLKTTDIVFCGRHSIDWNLSSFGPMLAEFLSWPSIFPVHKIDRLSDTLAVHRSLEGGDVEILEVQGPVVLNVTKGINEPRFPSLPQIMKSKSKPIEQYTLPENIEKMISIESLEFPKERAAVQMIEGTPEEQARKLVKILKEKEGLI